MDDNALRDRLRGTVEEEVLLTAADAGGDASARTLDPVTGGRAETVRVVEELVSLGLSQRVRQAFHVVLTARGARIAEQISAGRTNGRDRSNAVQQALGRWLYAHPERPARADLFAEDPSATAYGVRITVEEIRHAVAYLREHGLIFGRETTSGLLLRPGLTPEGRAAVESGEDISDYVRGGRPSANITNTANIHGGNVAGMQVGGQGNTLHVVQTVTHEQRVQVLAGIAEVRRGLADGGVVSAELTSKIDAVHEEAAKPDASRPNLRERITEAVAVAAVTEGAVFALQGLAALLNVVP